MGLKAMRGSMALNVSMLVIPIPQAIFQKSEPYAARIGVLPGPTGIDFGYARSQYVVVALCQLRQYFMKGAGAAFDPRLITLVLVAAENDNAWGRLNGYMKRVPDLRDGAFFHDRSPLLCNLSFPSPNK